MTSFNGVLIRGPAPTNGRASCLAVSAPRPQGNLTLPRYIPEQAASKLNPVSAPRRVRSTASSSQKPTQRARPEVARRYDSHGAGLTHFDPVQRSKFLNKFDGYVEMQRGLSNIRLLCLCRSARVAGNPAVTYNENDLARLGLAEDQGPKSKHDRRTLTGKRHSLCEKTKAEY